MTKSPSKPRKRAPYWLAVFGLAPILFAPVPAFLRYHGWSVLTIDGLVLGLICFATAAFLFLIPGTRRRLSLSGVYALATLFFFDFQFQALTGWITLAGAFGLVFTVCFGLFEKLPQLTTFVFGLMSLLALFSVPNSDHRAVAGDPNLPPIVYLIVDEHLGVGGIPALGRGPEIQEMLRDAYIQRGFRIYENAYSLHDMTQHSIASILNGSDRSDGLVEPGQTSKWKVTKSRLLKRWADQGYRINVYQSDALNLCDLREVEIDSCYTYSVWSLTGILEGLPWYSRERTTSVLLAMANRSQIFSKARSQYNKFAERSPSLPEWPIRARPPGPLAILSATKALRQDLARQPRGHVFLAHLLHPHFPYVYNQDCSVKPKDEWTAPKWNRKGRMRDMRKIREDNYPAYFDQLECATVMVNKLIDEIGEQPEFHDATLIVHGDHGSRIWVKKPLTYNRPSEQDLIDSFSTHLAIRGPGVTPGANLQPVSVNQAIAKHWGLPLRLEDKPGLYARPNRNQFPRPKLALPEIWRDSITDTMDQPD